MNSAPSEFLAAIAIRHKDRIVARNLEIIRKNLEMLERFFAKHDDQFNWCAPKAGPIAFPSLKHNKNVEAFCNELVDKTGVLLLPGTAYDPAYTTHFRIGFGRENMPECIEQLEKYMDSFDLQLEC